MPIQTTYPGVYIQEISSGVHTITGVSTSITAFVGRALRGPTNESVSINSFADFQRRFGGLGADYPMSYAVRDFYLNGGTQAIIVRLFKPIGPGDGHAHLTVDDLKLVASSPGKWGENLRVTVDTNVSPEVKTRMGLSASDVLFNLIVREAKPGGPVEQIRNVTLVESSRRIDRVLKSESSLVRWDGDYPANADDQPKLAKVTSALQAQQTLTSKQADLAAAKQADPTVPSDITAAQDAVATAQTALDTANADLNDAAGKAEVQLASAQKKLETAKKANPPVADDIIKANQTAVDNAKTAISDAVTAMKASASAPLDSTDYEGNEDTKTGIFALEKADLFNLLCIPPDNQTAPDAQTPPEVYQAALAYCVKRRAMLIVDPPALWSANKDTAASKARDGLSDLNLSGTEARNAALYFPRVLEADPQRDGQIRAFAPCGIIAGVMARTDAQRGVWKAPAGLDAALNGVQGLEVNLTDAENGMLNPLGINCLRSFPVNGKVVWGARTLRGADQLADEYKYIPIRRLALFLEESLYRGTQWVIFEPNDEPLWSQIRLNIGAFMHNLFRQGAFQGKTPRDAYFVQCDAETTTQNDRDLGIVNVVVGFAPLKPAEFVVISIQQMAGQIEV